MVPSEQRGQSKAPIGPFQKIVRAFPSASAYRARVLWADVEADPAVGKIVDRKGARVGMLEVRGTDDVDG